MQQAFRYQNHIQCLNWHHRHFELDFVFKPVKTLAIEGIVSIGDWIWNSSETASISLPNFNYQYDFDAKGVHVGDAAQIQVGGLIRYEPIKGLYFKVTLKEIDCFTIDIIINRNLRTWH